MDWSYAVMAIQQGSPGLIAIIVPLPLLLIASLHGRKLVSCLPGLVAILGFLVNCVVSGFTSQESSKYLDYLPTLWFLITAALIIPSVVALRRRWVGLLHLMTLAGALFLWFVSSMAIAHDWI